MERPTRIAILLSAALCPGAGQFVQRRWLAGTCYLTAFSVCLILLTIEIIKPIMANWQIILDFAERKADVPLVRFSVSRILFWLGLSLVVYFIGLLDTVAAYRRQCRQRTEDQARQLKT